MVTEPNGTFNNLDSPIQMISLTLYKHAYLLGSSIAVLLKEIMKRTRLSQGHKSKKRLQKLGHILHKKASGQ